MQMVRALGGSATPISWGELYTALQQGVVDGAENNPPSFYLSRHYEVCRYYSLDQHTWVPDVLLMSAKVWDELAPREQEIVQRAALEAAEYQKLIWAEASAEALAKVEESGVEIIRPDKEPFQAAVEEMLEEYRDQPEIWRWIERIRDGPGERRVRDGGRVVRIRRGVDFALEWLLVALMSLMVVNVLWQVATRFLLNDPSSFTEEIARYLLIWVGLLGSAYAVGKRSPSGDRSAPFQVEGTQEVCAGSVDRGLHLRLRSAGAGRRWIRSGEADA